MELRQILDAALKARDTYNKVACKTNSKKGHIDAFISMWDGCLFGAALAVTFIICAILFFIFDYSWLIGWFSFWLIIIIIGFIEDIVLYYLKGKLKVDNISVFYNPNCLSIKGIVANDEQLKKIDSLDKESGKILRTAISDLQRYSEMYSKEEQRLKEEDKKEWEKQLETGFNDNSWIIHTKDNNQISIPFLSSRFFMYEREQEIFNTFEQIIYAVAPNGIQKIQDEELKNMVNLRLLRLPVSLHEINLDQISKELQILQIHSSIQKTFGSLKSILKILVIVLDNGYDERFVKKVLNNAISKETVVYLSWENFRWQNTTEDDYRDCLFEWKEDLQNLDSQMQNEKGTQPFHRPGKKILIADFRLTVIER